jgi:hypothetical protein
MNSCPTCCASDRRPSTCGTHVAPDGAALLGWAVAEGAAVGAVTGLSVTLADGALPGVRLAGGGALRAGPAPLQAVVTAQATATANAAAGVRHRFLPRCTPRL